PDSPPADSTCAFTDPRAAPRALAFATDPRARTAQRSREGCSEVLRSRLAVGTRGVQADGRGLTLERHRWSLHEVVAGTAQGAQRGLGDEDVVAGQSRGGLDTGCRV